MKKFFILLILLIFASHAHAATIYKWVDKEGVVNFTDDLSKVPPSYRDRVEVETRKEVQEEKAPLSTKTITPISKKDETVTDIYGRDEAWWRDKVNPWKEKLKEATESLEKAQKQFADKTVEMGRKGLVSHARYQAEADKYYEEKKKYEAQIAEANEMLEKLSKEADESKANPDWLK